ncbi:GNAT family N-acetyltransferase [Chitinimonas arctica]|uniref:GNAT family N-acetyltransferase n=1 Tax=Chitinimonas arctica TaxID=2594795 RepID=A0A516SD82_9NEIS|nr:GNAT family N-acetyltransferase [Chitinimonas arctica]QDQ26109.1 GNAT family N-acetyltransferase [Chitinimonas arctica]
MPINRRERAHETREPVLQLIRTYRSPERDAITTEIILRPATSKDAPQVAEVLLLSRKAFLPYACGPHTDAEVYQWVREMLIPTGGVIVACSGTAIVGVLAIECTDELSWLDQLYLAPSHVGQGIGALLLDHALQVLPLPIRLYTFQANVRARAFYERHGFKAIAFTDGSENMEQCPDVLYELALRSSC